MLLIGKEIGEKTPKQAGRDLLAQLYLQKTGRPMPPVLLTEFGKPYFAGGPYFSISHSKRHVFCAMSDRPVGIDAEELDRPIRLSLADQILSAGERAQYENAPDKRLALLTFWVMKEAYAKLIGRGIFAVMKKTDFSLQDSNVTVRDGCLLAVIEEKDYAF